MVSAVHPRLLFADARGDVYEHPDLEPAGWDGADWRTLEPEDWTPLPEGSDLFFLPARRPVGYDPRKDRFQVLEGEGVQAVAAFLAPAYLRTLLPAYEPEPEAPALPLYAYTAVASLGGAFVACGLRVDPDVRQDPFRFELSRVEAGVRDLRQRLPGNRIVQHLRRCALEYHCRAAQNFFLKRYEAPLPAAPRCNALCVGCISLQPGRGEQVFPASHERIVFEPTPDELAEAAMEHIRAVGDRAVVSFGQGCEGEPLLAPEVLLETVKRIRKQTDQGTINLNTNASKPDVVEALVRAGLDSIRISTNSAREDLYAAYYRPRDYGFRDVKASAEIAARHGAYVMLNYFVFPGVTDTQGELDALHRWLREGNIRMIQLRNLNLDPEIYLATANAAGALDAPLGVRAWLGTLRRAHPAVRLGYFNPPLPKSGGVFFGPGAAEGCTA